MVAVKEEKTVFCRALIVVGFIFLANVGILLYRFNSANLTGFSVGEKITKTVFELPRGSKIFLIAEWTLILLFLVVVFAKDKGVKNRKQELAGINLRNISTKKGTDLDRLYTILRNKKHLRISTISKIFNIKKDVALNWAATLESGNLVKIDQPAVGEQIVKLAK